VKPDRDRGVRDNREGIELDLSKRRVNAIKLSLVFLLYRMLGVVRWSQIMGTMLEGGCGTFLEGREAFSMRNDVSVGDPPQAQPEGRRWL